MRIFVAQINPTIGDIPGNKEKIFQEISRAKKQHADLILFPELALCGYPPEDLLFFPEFEEEMEKTLQEIVRESMGLCIVVGFVRKNPQEGEKGLFNSAAIIADGEILGYKDKTLLPTYDVFDERRYFDPGEGEKIWNYREKKIGVLICEDAWYAAKKIGMARYKNDPVKELSLLKPDLVVNLSASPYSFRKKEMRFSVFREAAKVLQCPLILCNQVGGNDQLVFDGYSFCMNEKGEILHLAKGFQENGLFCDLEEKKPPITLVEDPYEDLYAALVLGIKDYFRKEGFSKALLGLSGGIDSSLVACIAADALGAHNLLALYMPSRYSAPSNLEDVTLLCQRLGIELKVLSIDSLFQHFLNFLSPFFAGTKPGTAEENLQARIRGMTLMALSNKSGSIVLSTGNKSEMAMGYCTLYGDMCGGLGVLIDVSKTQVYRLAQWVNRKKEIIPEVIFKKAPSAELRENQKDSDDLPDYAIVDRVLQDYVEEHRSIEKIAALRELDSDLVRDLVLRIHRAEYKRRQGPPGIRVSKRAFGKGRFFPIVQKWAH